MGDFNDNNFPAPRRTPQLSGPRRGRRLRWLIALTLLALAGAGAWKYLDHRRETAAHQVKGKLPPSGGKYFSMRVEIPVPQFLQGDARWSRCPLGPSEDTLGSAGCAVASTAMVLASYGLDTDPQRLNDFLTANDGYTERGWLKWEAAALIAPEKVKFLYEDLPSYHLIDQNLQEGNPVIVRLRYETGVTHFVVVCGKEGYDYLIRDPGSAGSRGVYPLREFGSEIEALRFYARG